MWYCSDLFRSDCETIVFGFYGGYFLGDKQNIEFWEMLFARDGYSCHRVNTVDGFFFK